MSIPVSSDILCFNISSRFKRAIAFKSAPGSGSTIIKIIHTGRARAISWMICLHCWPRANHFKNISGYQDLAALFTFNIHENTNVWTRFTKDTDRHIPRYPVGGTSSILRTFLGGTSQKTTLYVDAY